MEPNSLSWKIPSLRPSSRPPTTNTQQSEGKGLVTISPKEKGTSTSHHHQGGTQEDATDEVRVDSDGEISTAEKKRLANSFNFSEFARIAKRVFGEKDDESLWALADITIKWVKQCENMKVVSICSDMPMKVEFLNDKMLRSDMVKDGELGEEEEDKMEMFERKRLRVEVGSAKLEVMSDCRAEKVVLPVCREEDIVVAPAIPKQVTLE